MNRRTQILLALTLLPIAACSSRSMAPVTATSVNATDQIFVNAAAGRDVTAIQAGQLAATKARAPRVKRFAAKMVADHQMATQQLTTIAQEKTITVTPVAGNPAVQARLEADNNGVFDRDYLRSQIDSHAAAMVVFREEVARGSDPDLTNFAKQNLPMIEQHLRLAKQIAGAQ